MTHRFRTLAPRNTTAAGYGSAHMRERRRRLPLTSPTDPCAHCGAPLGPERLPGDRVSRWHLPHNPTRTGYLPGMAHARCNITDGAREGNRRQRATRTRRDWYRR